MIEIHQPEIEALIQDRLTRGNFANADEVLLHALRNDLPPTESERSWPARSGAEFLEALQRSPFSGLDVDFEAHRGPMPVREMEL